MLSIELFIQAMESLESKALHVRPLQCSRLRHQLSKCRLCVTCCPTGAISWGEPNIDADKCIYCGICATVCPNGVFEANTPSNEVLLQKIAAGLQHQRHIIFACSKYQQELDITSINHNIVTVPCLGRIDESILVGSISLSAEAVGLADAFCRHCDLKSGWSIVQQTAVIASNMLGMFGISERIYFLAKTPILGKKEGKVTVPASDLSKRYSRRDFFKALTQGTTRATVLAASSLINNDENTGKAEIRKSGLPFYLPLKRKLLLHSIKKLGRPTCAAMNADNLPFYQLKIDASCTGCGMCAYFCPTSALKKIDKAEKVAITFQLSSCTKCNLCQEICYQGSISAAPEINPDKLLNDKYGLLFAGIPIIKEPGEISWGK